MAKWSLAALVILKSGVRSPAVSLPNQGVIPSGSAIGRIFHPEVNRPDQELRPRVLKLNRTARPGCAGSPGHSCKAALKCEEL